MRDKQASKLVFDKVYHRYGDVAVLENLNLEVKAGEVVVLVGPSGCGKTTILNLLSGHIAPVSGKITREGTARTVYQQDGLFPWLTVSENVGIGLRSVKDEKRRDYDMTELLELVNLKSFGNHYPHQLSGGMRQRAELARVLAGDSDILLMDEPFSALDYQARLNMRSELARVLEKKPRTVVFVTHDIEEAAQLADRVLVLSKRPATICRELSITVPRPRGLADDEVVEAMRMILRELGLNNTSSVPE
ncbi:ABC transporter ATP-binding protein [Spirosoma aureum]|uniref:ABC transporter ATP-binding protein n=1 Tax=Spirosoma aureum TaxID=2692134 RepID=A0A6G9AJ68_9BACT|nr:ABC transporter ATP-binding protein [Spirosoma aureum]QIP12517.1 ABC transporter ATP-binding protein [Spirosoma aureum]